MSGKFSLDKGKRAERSVAQLLNFILDRLCKEHGVDPVWTIARNMAQTQRGGFDLDGGCDGSRIGLNWIAIEVKHHAEVKGKIEGWWKQTVEQAAGGGQNSLPAMPKLPWKAGDESGITTAAKEAKVSTKREPVLIYRGNGTKWRVRLWSLLTIDNGASLTPRAKEALDGYAEYAGGLLVMPKRRLRVVSDISMEDFLNWFEKRVEVEIVAWIKNCKGKDDERTNE